MKGAQDCQFLPHRLCQLGDSVPLASTPPGTTALNRCTLERVDLLAPQHTSQTESSHMQGAKHQAVKAVHTRPHISEQAGPGYHHPHLLHLECKRSSLTHGQEVSQ